LGQPRSPNRLPQCRKMREAPTRHLAGASSAPRSPPVHQQCYPTFQQPATAACMQDVFQAAVIGAGPAGLVAALALAKSGFSTLLLAPPYEKTRAANDLRTTALIGPSIELLRNLNVWRLCEGAVEPLAAVCIADDRGSIMRAPELLFTASELGMPA